jgi:hypothetical protein
MATFVFNGYPVTGPRASARDHAEIPGIDVHPDGVTAYLEKIVQAVLLEGRQIVSSFAGIADKSQESIQSRAGAQEFFEAPP